MSVPSPFRAAADAWSKSRFESIATPASARAPNQARLSLIYAVLQRKVPEKRSPGSHIFSAFNVLVERMTPWATVLHTKLSRRTARSCARAFGTSCLLMPRTACGATSRMVSSRLRLSAPATSLSSLSLQLLPRGHGRHAYPES